MKPKPSSGTGMLSAAGLTGIVSGSSKPQALGLAPPPSGAGKLRSPLPPPPNDPVAARMTSTGHGTSLKATSEIVKHSTDAFSDVSQLQVCWLFLVFGCSLLQRIICIYRLGKFTA